MYAPNIYFHIGLLADQGAAGSPKFRFQNRKIYHCQCRRSGESIGPDGKIKKLGKSPFLRW
jgi:hypothetical protein